MQLMQLGIFAAAMAAVRSLRPHLHAETKKGPNAKIEHRPDNRCDLLVFCFSGVRYLQDVFVNSRRPLPAIAARQVTR
jgi:hypothetical protein